MLILVLVTILVLGGLWLGQNSNLLPVEAATNAPVYDELFRVLFSIGSMLFIGMLGLVIYSLIKFRRRPGELGDGLALEGNLPLEVFWTAVPAVVVLFVGLYSYDIYDRMGGMQPLQAVSHDHHSMTANERVWGGIGSGPIESNTDQGINSLFVELPALLLAFLFHYPKGDIIS